MNKKRILVVDDDKDILQMLEYGLKKLGPDYEIYTAMDIFSAMNEIEKTRFDLILTDYMMPGLTGVDLARAARRMSPDTQVVLMTAYGTNKLRFTTDHLGFDGYLNKPFSIDQVRDIVKRAGDRYKPEPLPEAPLETQPLPNSEVAPAPVESAPSAGNASVEQLLAKLHVDAGTHGVLLINAEGKPVQTAGQLNKSKIEYVSALIAANFYAAKELSNLVDNPETFGASFYEGDVYNLYVCDVNSRYLLAVIFNARLRPGAVWFYTKQTAAALVPLLN